MTPADLDALERAARAATQDEWVLQDGCSWRRIGTHMHDGNIVCPTNHHLDGHPDLAARYEDLRYIVAAQPSTILSLLSDLRALTADNAKLMSAANDEANRAAALEADLRALRAQVEEAREIVRKALPLIEAEVYEAQRYSSREPKWAGDAQHGADHARAWLAQTQPQAQQETE